MPGSRPSLKSSVVSAQRKPEPKQLGKLERQPVAREPSEPLAEKQHA
jgi:hypothetical protein